eukprot:CAMPEP_0171329508 /NCGR_PEP_ID=MMETSP0878-20121228/1339_1 /TAXON_ID=67004 /ORGANISM="Thalassiosira weissflogii, Strain CCMP1336" /LENGTH=348 /DNA_ID=CAMNT_0011829549 /DNA_START=60 /DNA_END=1106 /DNA_ORIENTATION=-
MCSRTHSKTFFASVLLSLAVGVLSAPFTDYKIGEVIEIFDPSSNHDYSAYAFAAQIKDIHYADDDEKSISSYDVLPGFGLETLPFISPSVTRPLRPFEYGTSAMCDFGALKSTHDGYEGTAYEAHLIPCTVLALSPDSNADGEGGWYSVRYNDEETDEIRFSMRSHSKILRIVHNDGPMQPSSSTSLSSDHSDDHEDKKVEPTFDVGALVEIYDPTNHSPFAFPATVTSSTYDSDEDSYKYNLVHGITKSKMENVDENMIHAYEAQEGGTESLCNAAAASSPTSEDIFMVPCTIVSHSDDEKLYEVILTPEAKKTSLRTTRREDEARVSMPYLSVQRIGNVEKSYDGN